MTTNQGTLYTIGYATKPIETFLEQLKSHNIDAIADVRSVPYSKVFHDYHREGLHKTLKAAQVKYVFLGDELGPRSKQVEHYNVENQIQFDRLMASDLFLSGIDRVRNGLSKGMNIAMLCACKDPAICHRSLLVGYSLNHKEKPPLNINHILHDGKLETQLELETRLMTVTQTIPDMFTDEDTSKAIAYKKQCQSCAYIKEV